MLNFLEDETVDVCYLLGRSKTRYKCDVCKGRGSKQGPLVFGC